MLWKLSMKVVWVFPEEYRLVSIVILNLYFMIDFNFWIFHEIFFAFPLQYYFFATKWYTSSSWTMWNWKQNLAGWPQTLSDRIPSYTGHCLLVLTPMWWIIRLYDTKARSIADGHRANGQSSKRTLTDFDRSKLINQLILVEILLSHCSLDYIPSGN